MGNLGETLTQEEIQVSPFQAHAISWSFVILMVIVRVIVMLGKNLQTEEEKRIFKLALPR